MQDGATVTYQDFEPCLNHIFALRLDPSTVIDITLVEIEKKGPPPQNPQARQHFSLVFRGPMEPPLEQQTYALTHPTLGTLEVFLVPIGPDKQGMCYEAIYA